MEAKNPAEHVVEKFGGLTKLARGLEFPVSTVQGWKERGKIPQDHWLPIMNLAKVEGIHLALEEFVHGAPATPTTEQAA